MLVFRKGGGVAASPPCSHTASLVLLQDSELLNTSEETPWRLRTLGTSPGSVLKEAKVPAVAFQLALSGWVGRTGAVAECIALLVTASPSKSKNFYPPFLCPISEPGQEQPGSWGLDTEVGLEECGAGDCVWQEADGPKGV